MNEVIVDKADNGVRIVEIGAPEGATMYRYAQVVDGVVVNVVESHIDPDGVGSEWVACGNAGPGWLYDGVTFSAPPEPVKPADPAEWLIDIGPFFDRFGAAKMAALTSADPGVKAILADIQIRKWIDLKRADVATSLAYVGSIVPAIDASKQEAILTTPVSIEENLALRKLYFK